MKEIDEMDILGFFSVRAWKSNKDKRAKAPKSKYIDEVWTNLKP